MPLGRILTLTALALCACRSHSERQGDSYGKHEQHAPMIDSHYGDAAPREASAPHADTAMVERDERDFVLQAANGGRFEVESSQLALQKSISGPHRDFAQMMVEDHGRANRELEVLARGMGISLPADVEGALAQKLEDLQEADGKEFEQRYHEAQLQAHEDAIALFERAARECEDPALKSFAQKQLPTLREHQRELHGLGPALDEAR